MISHMELVACRAPNNCPALAGSTFDIKVASHITAIPGATVTIANDLSYTIKTPGRPDQTGQLTPDPNMANVYTYNEPGPPPVRGKLYCLLNQWNFSDDTATGNEIGVLEVQNS